MNSKDKNDEDFPNSSADLILALPAPQTSGSASGESEFTAEDYKNALRLLVGAALEGNDELRDRIIMWRATIQKGEQVIDASILEEETGGSPLLYTILGLLFKTPEYLGRGTSTAGRVSSRATSFVSRLMSPITNSWVMRPAVRRYNVFVARGEAVVNSLEEIGRSEARSSRALVHQQVNDETVEEALVYIVEKSKMREMIAETSAEVGADALTEIRGRSASVDDSLDNIVDNILRRQKVKTPPSGSLS
jgi:hypothetical protein